MSIHQTKKQSDLEKRLQLLRRQVYGKESVVREEKIAAEPLTTNYQLPTTDISYLHQDLLKTLTLSSLAIGTQILLFFLLKNHVLNINFF